MPRKPGYRLTWPLGLCALALTTTHAAAQTGARGGQWPSYGGDQGHTKFAPLDQINEDNVNALRVAWTWTSLDEELKERNAVIRDGATFRVRHALNPKEVERLHRQFLAAKLEVRFRAEHHYLVALNERNQIIAGIYYEIEEGGSSAHLEKIVAAERSGSPAAVRDRFAPARARQRTAPEEAESAS